MAENRVVKKYGKRPVIYVLILVILLAATGLLQWVNLNETDSYYYAAQAVVLVLGIAHIVLSYRFIPFVHPSDFWKGLGVIVLIILIASVSAAIAYHFIGLDYRFLTYIIPFCVPFLCWQVFRFFFQIPSPAYKSWYYPLNEAMPDLDMIDLSQIEVVQFVFSKNPQDSTQTNFTAKAPLNMALGQLFFIFINDYNDKNEQQPIHYLRSPDQPYGWHFYRKKNWFIRKDYLDPGLSFLNNAIQPNEFIYAQRVS